MLASIPSATLLGARGSPVTVEVHVGKGLPGYHIVGLPDTACRESRDRVRAAVISGGVRLAEPLHHRQPGPVGHAQDRCRARPRDRRRRPRRHRSARRRGGRAARVRRRARPRRHAAAGAGRRPDGRRARRRRRRRARSATPPRRTSPPAARSAPRPTSPSVVACLSGVAPWPELDPGRRTTPTLPALPDLADVRGQPVARRALEIAAAGGHHLLLVGSPGTGKTMLAQRLPGLLPPLDRDQAAGGDDGPLGGRAARCRPAGSCASRRSARRTTPRSIGRARRRRLGDAAARARSSLGHGGVLFLDELGEFPPAALDGLREPLEEGVIRVARAHDPRRAAGPLPARRRHQPVPVRRRAAGLVRVRRRSPGCATCAACPVRCSTASTSASPCTDPRSTSCSIVGGGEPSAVGRRAGRPRARRRARPGRASSTPRCPRRARRRSRPLSAAARALLRAEIERDRLTGRGYHRVRRVARTIADLDGAGVERSRSTTSSSRSQLRTSLRAPAVGPTPAGWIA